MPTPCVSPATAAMFTKMLEVIDQQARRPFKERPASGG